MICICDVITLVQVSNFIAIVIRALLPYLNIYDNDYLCDFYMFHVFRVLNWSLFQIFFIIILFFFELKICYL